MKKIFTILIIFFIPIFFDLPALAVNQEFGTEVAQFIKISPSAVGVGLGNSVCSIGDSPEMVFYNPALINNVKNIDISLFYTSWFQELHYNGLFVGYSFNQFGTIGLGVMEFFYGSLLSTKDVGEGNIIMTEDEIKANDLAVILTYGNKIYFNKYINYLYPGLNIKLISQTLGDISASSYNFDLGLSIKLNNDRLGAGFVIQNIGTKMKFIHESFGLPIIFKSGAHYKIDFQNHSIILMIALQKPKYESMIWNFGMEYNILQLFFLRGGYQLSGDAPGFKFGGGIKYKILNINYAFESFYDLGDAHRFGLLLSF